MTWTATSSSSWANKTEKQTHNWSRHADVPRLASGCHVSGDEIINTVDWLADYNCTVHPAGDRAVGSDPN